MRWGPTRSLSTVSLSHSSGCKLFQSTQGSEILFYLMAEEIVQKMPLFSGKTLSDARGGCEPGKGQQSRDERRAGQGVGLTLQAFGKLAPQPLRIASPPRASDLTRLNQAADQEPEARKSLPSPKSHIPGCATGCVQLRHQACAGSIGGADCSRGQSQINS